MTRADWPEFVRLLAAAAEICAGKAISDQGAALMFTALESCPLDEVRRAVLACAMASKFVPTLAEILEKLRGSAEDRARLAWCALEDLVRRAGYDRSVSLGDPCAHYAVERLGGWVVLCATLDATTRPFREREFARHYGDAERMGLAWGTPGVPTYLMGESERLCLASGHAEWVAPPVTLESLRRQAEEAAAIAAEWRREALGGGGAPPELAADNRRRLAELVPALAGREEAAT